VIVTRFAPSPTGPLHLGHALSALTGWRLAHATAGRFLLRIEDIDRGRCRAEFIDGIEADLRWLGIEWDMPVWRQSARFDVYRAALTRIRDMGLLYPCTCTRADIARAASAPQGPQGAVYPGTCRGRTDLPAADFAWRLDMAAAVRRAGPLVWHDRVAGEVAATADIFGDVVLARKDTPTSYHLAVTIDDAAQGVTDVVRGRDLFAATHVHRLLQALLELPVPRYHHHALVLDADGNRLAKRTSAATIADYRFAGANPRRLALALSGSHIWGDSLIVPSLGNLP
jgi:glutamyl-Q tRNA(Asp) synthetase